MKQTKSKLLAFMLALLCAVQMLFPVTALASGASTPTRVPDIGETVTVYTKDDYILDFSSAGFSLMDANGNEVSGGVSGLRNVMKIWVHTADGQRFTAYCLNMARHYPPTIAASDEANIGLFPVNFITTAWPAGANYDKMLWVIEHTYPAIPMDVMMADAGASFSRLVSEIQTAQSISQSEAETLAESVVYATIQQAIWHHQPAEITEGSGTYVGARMLGGNQDLRTLYSYLVKDRPEYADYRNGTLGESISIDHEADMTPRQEGGGYVFGPFSISTSMLSAGDVQLGYADAGSLTPRFTDAAGNALIVVRQAQPFYVRVDGTPTEPITITVQANTANALTLEANRGRMYMTQDTTQDVQPVGTGGVPHTKTASASLTLPTLNPPAPPAKTGEPVTFFKRDAESGAALAGAVIRIDNAAGEMVWQGESGPDGRITTNVELLYDTDYTYYEIQAPDKYDLDATRHTLRLTRDGGNPEYWALTNRLTVIEVPPVLTDVTLKKVDADAKAGLSGARFEVKDASGMVVGTYATGADGSVTIKNLPAGEYSYSETLAPTGYVLDSSVRKFSVSEAGAVTGTTVVENKRITGSVTISKVDESGNGVEGATIAVLDAAGKKVFEGKSGKDGKLIVSGLKPGAAYTYYETAAPGGYSLNSEKYTFTLDAEGKTGQLTAIVNKKIVTPTPTCPVYPTPTPLPVIPVLTIPATGDNGSMLPGLLLMAAGMGAAIFLLSSRKRRRRQVADSALRCLSKH